MQKKFFEQFKNYIIQTAIQLLIFLSPILRFIMRRHKLLIFLAILVTALYLAPEIYLRSKLNKTQIKAQVADFLKKGPLAVSFDDISFSAYGGLVIHDVQVSQEKDFSRSRTLLSCERAVLPFDFITLIRDDTFMFHEVNIDHATISLYLRNGKLETKAAEHLGIWLKQFERLTVNLNKTDIKLQVLWQGYDKDNYHIDDASLQITRNDGIETHLSFDNENWGKTEIHYKAASCFPETCAPGFGTFEGNLNRFPVFRLTMASNTGTIEQGLLSGKLKVDHPFIKQQPDKNRIQKKIEKEEEPQVTINFKGKLENFKYYENQKLFLDIDNIETTTAYRLFPQKHELDMTGKIEKYNFQFQYHSKDRDLLPSKLKLHISPENKEENTSLPFPGGATLTGLQAFNLDMKPPQQGPIYSRPYREVSGQMQVKNGAVKLNSNETIRIKDLNIKADKNSYKIVLDSAYKNSDAKINLSGDITPDTMSFTTRLYPDRILDTELISYPIAFYKTRLEGNIHSKQIFFSDFYHIVHKTVKSYRAAVEKGLNRPVIPSRFREKEWFTAILNDLHINADITIDKSTFAAEDRPRKMTGWLNSRFSQAEILIENDLNTIPEGTTPDRIETTWDYRTNYPVLKASFHITLPHKASTLMRPFIPDALVKDFKTAEIFYVFSAGGEHSIDLYNSHVSSGRFTLGQVKAGPYFASDLRDKTWQRASASFTSYGPKGSFQKFEAESEQMLLYGYGGWLDHERIPDFNIHYSVTPKR